VRVVFDSNIYISAFVTPSGQAGQALLKILDGTDILLISKPILDEVLATLAGKFSRDAEALSRTAFLLDELADIVKPDHRLDVLDDEPDNRVLECAEAGQADCIVTGDKAMLRLKQYEGIRLISLREYLAS
jgi:putative PIN family toxin of toxin-antitoxin system